MDQQPKIPTLKESQKPQVKLRGLGAGLTLFDRLKQFKKKDLAFILAGLGTLFMAPLAEHFMMAPDSGDAALRPGFGPGAGGGPGGGGIFGDRGNMSWENQGGLAPGGPTGGGSDLITPLNVRDPSALVMGPGATQQPPTNSVAPQTPPPTAPVARNESDLKDALAASARGATAAAKKALTPLPKIGLNSSGLRGLGAVSGGSSTSAGLGPINSAGLAPNHAATGGGLTNVRPSTGYKGLAARGPGVGGGGIEGLKAAADRAGSAMNRTGNAAADLNAAASQGVPNNGSGFGGFGQGGASANDKAAGGNQGKDGKNQGESLAFLKAKMDMEKENALKWKKREAADTELQMLQWRNKIGEAVAGKLGEGLASWITCPMSQARTGGLKGFGGCWTSRAPVPDWSCSDTSGNPLPPVPADQVAGDGSVACTSGGKQDEPQGTMYYLQGGSLYQCGGTQGLYGKCQQFGGDGAKKKDGGPTGGVTNAGSGIVSDLTTQPIIGLAAACKTLKDFSTKVGGAYAQNAAAMGVKGKIDSLVTQAGGIAALRDALGSSSDGATSACGGTAIGSASGASKPLTDRFNDVTNALSKSPGGIASKMDQLADQTDETNPVKLADDVRKPVLTGASDSPAIVTAIQGLQTDINAIKGKKNALAAGVLSDQTILSGMTDDQFSKISLDRKNVASAIGTVQGAGTTVGNLVDHFDTSINSNLVGQVAPALQGSVNESLSNVIKENAAAAPIAAKADPNKAGNTVPPDGFPSDLKPAQIQATAPQGGAETSQAVTQASVSADSAIQTAVQAVTAYKALPADQQKAQNADVQQKIDAAGSAVSNLRGLQKAVDGSILANVREASGRVLGSGVPVAGN